MPGFQGLQLDAFEGDRWELALSLIESGEADVKIGSVVLRRDTSGPTADGCIHVTFMGSTDPAFLTRTVAEAEMQRGVVVVREAAAADPRFGSLLRRCGLVREYVWDYGMGTTLLASMHDDDTIDWRWKSPDRA